MQDTLEIENIEEMRRSQGIDDVQLRLDIRGLKVGDLVRLTLIGTTAFETVLVRITSIRGSAFRGKLVTRPTSVGLSKTQAHAAVTFTTDHIHSILRAQATHA